MSERRVAAVVVAYRSDPDALGGLLARLVPQTGAVFVVDNSDDAPSRAAVAGCAGRAGASLEALGGNTGIAAAQNRGIALAREAGFDHVVLFDDDSRPPPDLVETLLAGMRALRAAGERVAAVGPLVCDARAEEAPLYFSETALGPRRGRIPATPPASGRGVPGVAGAPPVPGLPAAFLLASGSLIAMDAMAAVGPMREDLFIDHVDLEWGLRARRAGWTLRVLPAVRLDHRLGERVLHPWFLGGRRVHVHAPARNYYLARNTLLLIRSGLLSPGWTIGYLLWLAKYLAFNLLCVPPRARRLRLALRGLRDGLLGRGGPLPATL